MNILFKLFFATAFAFALTFGVASADYDADFAKANANANSSGLYKSQDGDDKPEIQTLNVNASKPEDIDDEGKDDDSQKNISSASNIAEQHKSAVAKYVSGLLKVADSDKKIGEQVKVFAESQKDEADKNEQIVNKITSRSKIKTFLFGSDYKNLGELRSSLVTTQNDINQLKNLAEKAGSEQTKTELNNQIKLMETELSKINTFIKTNSTRITLFGWLLGK